MTEPTLPKISAVFEAVPNDSPNDSPNTQNIYGRKNVLKRRALRPDTFTNVNAFNLAIKRGLLVTPTPGASTTYSSSVPTTDSMEQNFNTQSTHDSSNIPNVAGQNVSKSTPKRPITSRPNLQKNVKQTQHNDSEEFQRIAEQHRNLKLKHKQLQEEQNLMLKTSTTTSDSKQEQEEISTSIIMNKTTISPKLPTDDSTNINIPNRVISSSPTQIEDSLAWKLPPPCPRISLSKKDSNITITLTMDDIDDTYAEIPSYEIYKFKENKTTPEEVKFWKCVGTFEVLASSMCILLPNFNKEFIYHFMARAVDIHGRRGPFSIPQSIDLN